MFKAVTFDLDNTLIDFMGMKRAASDAAAQAMVTAGLDLPVVQAKRLLFEAYLLDIEGEHAFEDFLKEHDYYSEEVLQKAINAYEQTKFKHLKPYEDVFAVLSNLKNRGLLLAIITDAPKNKALQRLDAMGLKTFFDVIITFEDTKKLKPAKEPFLLALEKLGVEPSEALHVGDYRQRDVLGAKNAGMKTAWAKYGNNLLGDDVQADFVLEKFTDLLSCL